MNKIFLIGPSLKIGQQNLNYYNTYKNNGYISISYAGSIFYLEKINFVPDYFAFFDPSSLIDLQDNCTKNPDFYKQIKPLYIDMYDRSLIPFQKYGFSTRIGNKKRIPHHKSTKTIQQILSKFSNNQPIDPKNSFVNRKKPYENTYNFHEKFYFFGKTRSNGNIDKLFCILLPMVLFQFYPIEDIHTIGFGDFSVPREQGSDLGYASFKADAEISSQLIYKYILANNINLTFENITDNYFYELYQQYKDNQIDPK